jgi:hypothetical protein
MTFGGVFLLLLGGAVAFVAVATLVTARRGGRGPGDPPASHLRVDPAGFPALSTPHGVRFRSPRPRPRRHGPSSLRSLRQAPRRAAAG